MQSLLSLLTGAVFVVLVYGLSFLPTATLTRSDDIGLMDDDSPLPDVDDDRAQFEDPSSGAG
jgi:hypothetical protein